jgi:6-phosphogluconate dehydrogenase (decarboxylating)
MACHDDSILYDNYKHLLLMSFLVHNDIDREYIARISQETRILKSSKLDWDVEEVTRFASLLKVD